MLKALATGATLLASLAATAAPAAASPAPAPRSDMTIKVVAANGSGCPLGSAQVTPARDGKAFTVTYSQFTAQVGVGTKPGDFRKNCQLALDVRVPQGYTYAVSRTDYRGFASIQRGANASLTAFTYFQGDSRTGMTRYNFNGPTDGNWQRSKAVGISALSFRPCGGQRYLNINNELRVSAGSTANRAASLITMDSTDGNLDTTYHVAWKKC
ncbi:DUF4360 domain-containing protein [Paractinoplanes ferrugineus]|uniref:DUF4360 domain-containing protein n=1 Tax=Paractinoplanes ferrugineus TaxID=113564 RepID=A0A919JAA5_9ACTN|nr:DUF4360 domain-containing protein [Actinoplanes ferrugineus]GIE16197.1 hypothetical protein Afe05nite_80370 [Actinoplanes ferrugineus]